MLEEVLYKILKDRTHQEKDGKYAELEYLPDFFAVLCHALAQPTDIADRRNITAAIAYVTVTHDILPDDKYGKAGFLDDLFISAWVLEQLIEKHGNDFLKPHWDVAGVSLKHAVDTSIKKTMGVFGAKGIDKKILHFAGILHPDEVKARKEASAKKEKRPVKKKAPQTKRT